MTVIEYEVLTPGGWVLLTTPELDIARAFVRARSKKVPGLSLRIEEIETSVARRRVAVRPKPATARLKLRLVGGGAG